MKFQKNHSVILCWNFPDVFFLKMKKIVDLPPDFSLMAASIMAMISSSCISFSLGFSGMIPFALKISFHSVSSFGSCIFYDEQKHNFSFEVWELLLWAAAYVEAECCGCPKLSVQFIFGSHVLSLSLSLSNSIELDCC